MIWYYIDESITDGDRRKGPYSIDELMEFVKSEKVKPQTLVWHSGMKDWVHWEDMEESKASAGLVENDTENSESSQSEEEQIKAALEAILAQQKATKRYAGFLVRAAACIVDNLILSFVGAIILMVLNAMQVVDLTAMTEAMNAYIADPYAEDALSKLLDLPSTQLFLTVWSIIQGIYFIVFTAIKSATPGKMLFKIHVEPVQIFGTVSGTSKVSWLTSTLRYVASIFTQFTMVFYGIGYLVVLIDPKRRALHDWIARTYVVHDTSVKIKVRPDGDDKNNGRPADDQEK